MRYRIETYIITAIVVMSQLTTGCTGVGDTKHVAQVSDSLYTEERAMGMYDQEPERALQIIDSAEIVGNMSDFRAELLRVRVYAYPCDAMNLDTQFDRQAAIDHFHLSKERIGAAFSQGSEFSSIADFINHCRLEYARELLTISPEMSIDEIASAAGFSTRRTFSRLFKECYSITPTDYRSQKV